MRPLLVVLALGFAVASQAGLPGESIEDFIDSALPASGVPGVAYAVVADGTTTSVGARGVDRKGNGTEVTPDTPFVAGSISKSFTALAIMQLVEAGEVELDAEVSVYLDAFSGRPAGAITIRQLLGHTSGYSTLQGNTSHTDVTSESDELARRIEARADVDPAYQPGERWEYSNTNYLVLGRVIEVVSGQSYQAYVEANIMDPIGMDSSFVSDGDIHPDMATGHTPWFGTKRPLADNTTSRGMAPAGGVVSTANDLALYLQMMMNGTDDVLSAEGKAQMLRPASAASPFYGFGWYINSENNSVWHSGSTPGVETLATMVPTEDKGVVVLVNGGSGVGFGETTQLRNGITARAIELDYADEGARWAQKTLFISLVLLPFVYLVSMVWAWFHRDAIRSKSGVPGLFSLWFPLLTTSVAAWVILRLMPSLLGAPLRTIALFQPDLGLALTATALFGILWAVFRLGLAYTGAAPSD